MAIIRKLFSSPEGINMRERMGMRQVGEPDGGVNGHQNMFNTDFLFVSPQSPNCKPDSIFSEQALKVNT